MSQIVYIRIFLVGFCKILMGNDVLMMKTRLVSGFMGLVGVELITVSRGSRLDMVRALWLIFVARI